MQYYGSFLGIATKHKCRYTFLYGLDTNQFIKQSTNSIELIELIKNYPVYINPRLTASAGKAIAHSQRHGTHIQLHPALVDPQDYVSADFFDTFFHEIAHIVAWKCTRKMAHDFTWMYCFKQFGFEPNRCYNGHQFNYRGYRAREVQRFVDEIASELPDFGDFDVDNAMQSNAAKGNDNDKT